jgi:hypothetical protein
MGTKNRVAFNDERMPLRPLALRERDRVREVPRSHTSIQAGRTITRASERQRA